MFEEIGDLLEIRGENPFKVRAYRRAAGALLELTGPAWAMSDAELHAIAGFGDAITQKIVERVQTGSLGFLERLHAEVPETVRELVRLPGIGPKTAGKLLSAGITSRLGVQQAVVDGRLVALVGQAAAERIGRGLVAAEPQSTRFDLSRATAAAATGIEVLNALPSVTRAEPAGSLRRAAERVGDVNLAAAALDPAAAQEALVARLPEASRFDPLGVRFPLHGLIVAVRFAPPTAFGSLWQWWTGSVAHNEALAARARDRGLRLTAFGIAPAGADGFVDEESLYGALGLAWLPPELRENRGEIALAAEGRLPRLVTVSDLKGDLHVHTDWSDGAESFERMVAGATARGYAYLAITDHSGGRAVANGLDLTRLAKQIERIRRYNEASPDGPLVLAGSEVDIRADGSLDYPDEALRQLDVVIASVHSAMDQPRETMTARLISAARHRYVTAIGHLTGRLIGRRDPVAVDVEAVLRACAESSTWVEINAHPSRLDLNEDHVRLAKELGVLTLINTDAHSAEQFDLAVHGVGIARRAWLGPDDVVNTRSAAAMVAALGEKRR